LTTLLPFVLILLVFWFLVLRPQQRRQRDLRALQSSLSTGSEVMLTSVIFGTVSDTTDDHVVVEIASGVDIRVARAAIAQVLTTPETAAETATESQTEPEQTESAGSEEN
jgi:preprotein translocase subunit YajC